MWRTLYALELKNAAIKRSFEVNLYFLALKMFCARLGFMKLRFLLLVFLVLFASQASAAELADKGTMTRKLQRGFLNIALSPYEIAKEFKNDPKTVTQSFFPTWISALGRGTFLTAGRAIAGAVEIVTFPIPLPSDYEPIVYPELPWEDSNETATS